MSVLISGPPEAIRGSKVDVARLRRRGAVLLKAVGERRSELSIALVDDAEIKRLNAQWRNRPRATDVLSFSQVESSQLESDSPEGAARLLGDVVISVETAARMAADRHRGLDETITRLLVHGVLHLVGHDHEKDDEAAVMQAEERRLWRELNP